MCCLSTSKYRKLEPKSRKCVFLGYAKGSKGYRLWIRNIGGFKVVVSRDVVFNEHQFPCIEDSLRNDNNVDLDEGIGIEVEPSRENRLLNWDIMKMVFFIHNLKLVITPLYKRRL
ncbi:Reverse transcriptase Ty1/copia-type domain-containing protein [Abeliophyllum distichum]|uniref:Reverse transcriptase Ty1/copia-type domain-containing protein n=1 Tax=Abeliophyllum distichum TaxID=126358 RepID=A0ABD1SX29_9LAMI